MGLLTNIGIGPACPRMTPKVLSRELRSISMEAYNDSIDEYIICYI